MTACNVCVCFLGATVTSSWAQQFLGASRGPNGFVGWGMGCAGRHGILGFAENRRECCQGGVLAVRLTLVGQSKWGGRRGRFPERLRPSSGGRERRARGPKSCIGEHRSEFRVLATPRDAGHLLNFKVAVKVASGMGSEKKNWRCGPEFGDESNSSWAQAEVSTALLAGGWGARGDTGFLVLQKITADVARAGCWLRVSDICWAKQMGRASGALARKVAAKFGGPPTAGSGP